MSGLHVVSIFLGETPMRGKQTLRSGAAPAFQYRGREVREGTVGGMGLVNGQEVTPLHPFERAGGPQLLVYEVDREEEDIPMTNNSALDGMILSNVVVRLSP